VRLGVFGSNSGVSHTPAETVAVAQLAEQVGFDSIWAGEHVVVPNPRVAPSPMDPTDPILDPLVHLAFVAAATQTILLATGIIILPQRNPLVLAKQAATLDVLSGGRLLLGIGAGYLEPEMTALGTPMARRGERTDDHLAAMRAIWNEPGPVSHDGPRIVVGGHTPAAFRRAVAHGHGWYGFALAPEDVGPCVEGLRRAADEVDRPAGSGPLEISVTPRRRLTAEALEAFTAAGVDRLVVNVSADPTLDAVEQRLRAAADLAAG
jgi:alkanesulfonate monooxygenase SsuD/methylene tetrahydromethanopterin reductase-like flavin-dependent oxidoreductase (luciferase family)